jgi:hypothetical protein
MNIKYIKTALHFLTVAIITFNICYSQTSTSVNSNENMAYMLADIHAKTCTKTNIFCSKAFYEHFDSIAKNTVDIYKVIDANANKAEHLLNMGKEAEALDLLEDINTKIDTNVSDYYELVRSLAITYMRLGERQNCVANHSSESCIMPIQGNGVHILPTGSSKAIQLYKRILNKYPTDYESMWMLNIAYMTLGKYPSEVPKQWLVPNLDKNDSIYSLKPFTDVAHNLGLAYRNCAGGAIVEDLNNDGYMDIVTSDWHLDAPMHCFLNNQKGGFDNISESSNLKKFTGGLNIIHADYDNDGDNDIFVLRGGWMMAAGEQPNSLLRNNGDNTFTDVTIASGLLSLKPTQTATFRDFNNDGWLDIFIGNESYEKSFPCELYMSNQNGTFTEVAESAGCNVVGYVKGVHSADFNNDGLQDIVVSAFEGRALLQNVGIDGNGLPHFENITANTGINDLNGRMETFGIWFWDYDNDGWQDIFVCGYRYPQTMAFNSATDALGIPNDGGKLCLYHNNKNGTYTNVSKEARIYKTISPMGVNFGDIDNDGFLDMYLGTGNPVFSSLTPNKLFRNMGNGSFADVTVSAKVGNLQKGHGVAMVDIDNDGDCDIFEEIGGAYKGDAFINSLYLNPGQNNNNWIKLILEGTITNRSAIGTRIKLTFKDGGVSRNVYVDVNTGASFGSSSLRREIGLGSAKTIDEIEITWAATNKKQIFKNVQPNQLLKIKEGSDQLEVVKLKKLKLK